MKYQVFVFVLLISFSLSFYDPLCQVNQLYDNTPIFTEKNSVQYFNLNDYITGGNLHFEIEDGEGIEIKQVTQNVQKLHNQLVKKYVGFDKIEQTSGDYSSAFVAESIAATYVVNHGQGNINGLPEYSDDEYKMIPANEKAQKCYGINLLSEKVAVTNCVEKDSIGSLENVFYFTSEGQTNVESTSVKDSSFKYDMPTTRISKTYLSPDGNTYLLQGVKINNEQQSEKDEQLCTYVSLYKYKVGDENNKFVESFEFIDKITGKELDISGDLQFQGIEVVGEYIYVLNASIGIKKFQIINEKVDNLTGILDYYRQYSFGFSVTFNGNYTQLIYNTQFHLFEYNLDIIVDEEKKMPLLLNDYKFDLRGSSFQSNGQYIAWTTYDILYVVKKNLDNPAMIKTQIRDIQLFELLYNDQIYIFPKSENLLVSNQIQRHLIQTPFIVINANYQMNKERQITIKAESLVDDGFWSPKSKSCQITLISTVVDQETKSVYELDQPSSTGWQYLTSQQSSEIRVGLGDTLVGANIDYSIEIEDREKASVVYSVVQEAQINIKDFEQNWAMSFIIPSEKGEFYQLYSTEEDKSNIQVFRCSSDQIDVNQVDCRDSLQSIKLDSQIKSISEGEIGLRSHVLAVLSQKSSNQVELYDFSSQKEEGKVLKTENFDDKLQFIKLYRNVLYVITQNNDIMAYDIDEELNFTLRSTLTQEMAQNWPSVQDWNPSEIQVSSSLSDALFIINSDGVYIASSLEPVFRYISHQGINSEVDNYTSFYEDYMVYSDFKNQIRQSYLFNIADLTSYQEFNLYGYDLLSPLTIAQSDITGFIYVLSQQKGSDSLFVMVYQSGQQNVESLLKVIEIDQDFKLESDNIDLWAQGSEDVDYVYVQYNDKKVFIRSPLEQQGLIFVDLASQDNDYVAKVNYNLDNQGWDGSSLKYDQEEQLVNSSGFIELDTKAIRKQIPEYVTLSESQQSFKLNTENWYTGSVSQIDLLCSPNPEICLEQVSIRNIVDKNPEDRKIYGMGGISQIENTIYGIRQAYIQTDYVHYEVFSLDMSLTHTHIIDTFDSTSGSPGIIAAPNEKGKLDYILLTGQNSACNLDLGYSYYKFQGVKSFVEGQYYFLNSLLFVNSNNQIFIFNPKVVENNSDFQQVQAINPRSPGMGDITSFDLIEYVSKKVQVLITTSDSQLIVIDLDISNNYEPDYKNMQILDLASFIKGQNLFITEETEIIYLKLISSYSTNINALIQTSNTATYQIQLKKDSESGKIEIEKSYVSAIYNNIGYYEAIPLILMNGNTFTISYKGQEDLDIRIAMYELQEQQKEQGKPVLVSFQGTKKVQVLDQIALIDSPVEGINVYSLGSGILEGYQYHANEIEISFDNPADETEVELIFTNELGFMNYEDFPRIQTKVTSAAVKEQLLIE